MRSRLLALGLVLLVSAAHAQQPAVNVPAAARVHLTKTYPGAVVGGWKQGGKHLKAQFKLKGEGYQAVYTSEGVWVRTEHNIPKADLPTPVTAALKAGKYGDWKITDVEEHASPTAPKVFKVKVSTEVKKAELLFAPDGKLLNEEVKTK